MKKKVTDKAEKSKKKQRTKEEPPKQDENKWQDFLHRHKVKKEEKK